MRKAFLAANPLCVDPFGEHPETVTLAVHVDHREAVSGPDDPRFFDMDELQGMCGPCHSRKTASEDGGFGNQKRGGGRESLCALGL